MDVISHLATPAAAAVTSVLFLSAYLFYRWLLPKPIPGIPYNEEATKNVLGDIPSMLKHLTGSKTYTDWILSNNIRHEGPIVQIFTKIFGRPWVLISDNRECQDILLRRTKEFDKPDGISDMLSSIAPDHHTVLATNDQWRAQRKLLQDLMTPSFLNGVAAPEVYQNLMDLIKVWTEKERLAKGRPWTFKDDIYDVALEAIWAAVFGMENTATVTREQLDMLAPLESIDLPASKDKEAVFERAKAPPAFEAVLKLTDSLEMVGKSPMPRVQGYIMRYLMPSIIRLMKLRDQAIRTEVLKAEERMNSSGKTDNIKAGVDHMLRREKLLAEKQGRKPDYHSKIMYAELFGLLLAGHDTTSTSLLWSLKFLASNPDVQTRLRDSLHAAFPAAHASGSVPSATEIATTTNHYLDACIEELLRCGSTAPICSRTTTQDCVSLGKVIPKGTRVILMTSAHGVKMPAFEIDKSLRNETYLAADGGKTGYWDLQDMHLFNPDRWLVTSESGEKVFDAQAGPHLLFGGGLRGCFGKRLAYLEKRLALVLILWHFVLEDVPEEYAGYEAMELLTHSPQKCYVRLRKVQGM